MDSDDSCRVSITLCGHGAKVAAWLESQGVELTDIETVPEACGRPERAIRAIERRPHSKGVVALCRSERIAEDVLIEMRRAGKHPEGFVFVYPWAGTGFDDESGRAERLVWAALVRARAYHGMSPANLVPYFPMYLSRRSMLRFLPLAYRVVPRVDHNRCAASDGCRMCEQVCPADAISIAGGRVELTRTRCISCGSCVGICPTGSLVRPGVTYEEVAAHVEALLNPTAGSRTLSPLGIVYTCWGAPPDPSWHWAWLPVAVACSASTPMNWILAPLVMGADAVAVAECKCSRQGAPASPPLERLEFCRSLLGELGHPKDRIFMEDLSLPPEPWFASSNPEWMSVDNRDVAFSSDTHSLEGIVRTFLQEGQEPGGTIEGSASPLGVVTIEDKVCTGCGMCARACPFSALSYEEKEGRISLLWEHAACTGCGACETVCPELKNGAIRVRKAIDLSQISIGKHEVAKKALAKCKRCGQPIAPLDMVERVLELLGEDAKELGSLVSSYCGDCRVTGEMTDRGDSLALG